MRIILAVLVCAACGGGGGPNDHPDSRPGAPDAAAAPDGSPDARAVGSIHVSTQVRCCEQPWGSPASGITIDVIAPDGTLAATTMTDVDGSATIEAVVAGSAVMAVYPDSDFGPTYVTTVLGVEPGDTLVFGDTYYAPSIASGPGGHFTLDFPPIAASYLVVQLPCGGGVQMVPSPPQTPYLYEACQNPDVTLPVIAVDASFHVVASAVLSHINLAIDGSYSVAAWTPALAQTVTATVPTTAEEVNLLMEWRYPYALPSEVHSVPIVSQVASATFAAPTGADAAVATAVLYHDGLGSQGHAQAFAPDIGSADVTIGDLPWLAAPELSLADQRLRWDPVGAGGDAVYVDIRYDSADGAHEIDWAVIAPPGTGELSWASFPAEVPAPRDPNLEPRAAVRISDLGTASSYRELRAAPEWQIRCPLCAVERGDQPAAAQAADDGSGLEN